jgi:hypothetical protein
MNFPFEKLDKLRVLKLGENLISDFPATIGFVTTLDVLELEKNP